MGGYGSGQQGTRPVAEQSSPLPIGLVAPVLRTLAPGGFATGRSVRWRWSNGDIAAVAQYSVSCAASGQITVWLAYLVGERIVSDPIAVVTTCPQYGGLRYWWSCPDCGGRAGVLYCPSRRHLWRCRQCYQVTYASSNASGRQRALEWRVAQLRRRGQG